MTKPIFPLLAAMALVFASSCSKENLIPSTPKPTPTTSAPADTGRFVPGVSIVLFSEELTNLIENDVANGKVVTKSMGLNTALDELGIESITRLFPHAGEFEPRTRREGLHRWYKVVYAKNVPLTKASVELESIAGVELVEGQYRTKINDFVDEGFSRQWHYYNTSTPGADINVKPVWQNYTTGDPKVIVAVVDGGVDLKHADLADACIAGGKNGSKNFVRNNYIITGDSHGTHVAGTIGAINNNLSNSVCGIAGGDAKAGKPGVRLLSCQIFDGDDGSGGAAAIKWGADHGAVISQNSWGYVVDTNEDGIISSEELKRAKNMSINSSDKAAIDYFNTYAGCDNDGNQLSNSPMKGGVVIFAAGNDALEYGSPGSYEGVIAVGSINSEGYKSDFSNYGSWVDIAAPGSGVYSTLPNNKYGNMSGTSMACPHVSGVAALVVSYHGGPGFTNEMLRNRLINGAKKNSLSSKANIGPLVDALGAITYGSTDVPAPVSTYTAEGLSNNIDFTWKVTANSKKVAAFGYVLLAGPSRSAVETANLSNPTGVNYTIVEVPADAKVGDNITGRISGLEFNTDYYVSLAAFDYGHNFSSISTAKQVKTGGNNPPVVHINAPSELIENGKVTIHAFQTADIPIVMFDPDGHNFNHSFTDNSSAASIVDFAGNKVIRISGKAAKAGNYSLSITATDQYGSAATASLDFEVLENQAPIKTKDFENILTSLVGMKSTIDASDYFHDPDGEQLTYTFSTSNKNVAHLNPSENLFYLTILGYGLADVTVTASDALGKTVSSSFKILVRQDEVVADVYPNPVSTTLYIRTGETMEPTQVQLISPMGTVVYSKTETFSALYPLEVDMRTFSPGIYTLNVSYSGKSFTSKVVKK